MFMIWFVLLQLLRVQLVLQQNCQIRCKKNNCKTTTIRILKRCVFVMSQNKEIRAIQLSIPLGLISWAQGTDTVCGSLIEPKNFERF